MYQLKANSYSESGVNHNASSKYDSKNNVKLQAQLHVDLSHVTNEQHSLFNLTPSIYESSQSMCGSCNSLFIHIKFH
jgi:hypothetical protein